MMKRNLVLLLVLILLWVNQPMSSHSQSQTAVVINNAETTTAIGLTTSPVLSSLLVTVPSMVLNAFAEATAKQQLLPVPVSLAGLLNQHAPAVLFASLEASYHRQLIPISVDLQARLATIKPYTLFAFTDASYERALHYPATLLSDTTPPQLMPASPVSVGGITYLQWRTNEFTTSTLRYGTASGAYTDQFTDELFAQEHSFNIMAFAPGQTYYVQITSKDRNGNEMVGNEFTVVRVTTQNLYLPLIRKR